MVKGWAVMVSPKKNYVIIYNTKNNKNHLLARVIAKRIEMIREQIYEVQFPPAKPITTVCIVRVCADAKEYRAYGGPGGSAGYWSSARRGAGVLRRQLQQEARRQHALRALSRGVPPVHLLQRRQRRAALMVQRGTRRLLRRREDHRQEVRHQAVPVGAWAPSRVPSSRASVRSPKSRTPQATRASSGRTRATRPSRTSFASRSVSTTPTPACVTRRAGASSTSSARSSPKNKKYNAKWGHILTTYFDSPPARSQQGRQARPRWREEG